MRLMRRSTAALSSPRVMQGDFGRVTLKASARSMAAHGHAEYHCVFKLAGADTGFAVGQQRLVLDSDHAIVVNPWQTHAKLDSDGEPTLALALLLDAGWLAGLMGWDRSRKCGVFCQQRAALSPDIRGKVARLQQVMAPASMRSGCRHCASSHVRWCSSTARTRPPRRRLCRRRWTRALLAP